MVPNWEKIVETKTCRISGKEFAITDRDLEFYDKVSPVFSGKKYSIPTPTLCFDERRRRKLCFYNQKSLYKNTCAITWKEIISRIPPESGLMVYSIEAWSDRTWDAKKFGIALDLDRSFFDQVHHLIRTTPYQNLVGASDNSTNNALYTNYTADLKDCYLIFNANRVIDGYYSTDVSRSEWCVDCLSCAAVQHAYSCVSCEEVYGCFWCEYVTNSRHCVKSRFLQGCDNCLACAHLSHKTYHILNREVSEKEFRATLEKYFSDETFRNIIDEKYRRLCLSLPVPCTRNINAKNSLGDTLYNVENCTGFNMTASTNCHYCETITESHDLMDVSYYGHKSEYMYESVAVWRFSQGILFSGVVGKWTNLNYCLETKKSQNCFWCVNMHYVDHCILNTPYSTQEYETLCWKIIDHMRSTGEWWEFFPHEFSPFGYNESLAQEYFPLTESETHERWWRWYTEPAKPAPKNIYSPLPIADYDEKKVWYERAQKNIDEILAGILLCEVSGKPFKVIKPELAFYIENALPIPRKHPDQRHRERMDLRNPRTLYERTCAECQKAIITTYAPEKLERVVCENCYRSLVY